MLSIDSGDDASAASQSRCASEVAAAPPHLPIIVHHVVISQESRDYFIIRNLMLRARDYLMMI